MTTDEAAALLNNSVVLTREDIARAKNWIISNPSTNPPGMVDHWLREQKIEIPKDIDTDSLDCAEQLKKIGRNVGVRLAFYQAIWELVNAGELIPAEPPNRWELSLGYKTSHHAGGLKLRIGMAYPSAIERPQLAPTVSTDADIFLKGIDCKTLHSGIHEAIQLALSCFRRGFYMPATAMLAAGVEATWTECGVAVARNLGNTTLQKHLADQPSFAKLVGEVRKVLEPKAAKPLLDKARRTIHEVTDAEVWTTTLRERRNALHWGKAKSFIADHSETGTLLMAAQQHIGTLEAIRAAC